jgi:hypothetical protein
MNTRIILVAIIIFIFSVLGVLVYIVWTVFPSLDITIKAFVIGALAGTLGGLVGSAITSLVNLWDRERDAEERLKDRVSSHALELTQMDYQIRQKALEVTKKRKHFLAPIKVYRELYKALLELHKSGTWPDAIHKLGLLGIFETGAEDT